MMLSRFMLYSCALALIITRLSDVNVAAESKSMLRVATAQIPVTRDIVTNAVTIHRALDVAIAEQADILLTPEGSLSGYTHEFDQAEVEKHLTKILERTSSVGIALALGTCFIEPDDNQCYNEIRFYDTQGKLLGFHTKTLLCSSLTAPPTGEINHYGIRPLRTFEINGIRVGGLICNDMWGNPQCTSMPDPHLSQRLSDTGAQVLFVAINGGRDGGDWSKQVYWHYHETNMRMRAKAGKVWVVSADNCFPMDIPCSAPSGVVTPSGDWAAKANDQGEHVVVHTIVLQ